MKIRILREKIQAYLDSKSTLLTIRLSRTNPRITDLLVWLSTEERRIRTDIIRTSSTPRRDIRGVITTTVSDAEIGEQEVWYQDFLNWVKLRRLDNNQALVDALFGPESMKVFHASNLVFLDLQTDQSKRTLEETRASLETTRAELIAARIDGETKEETLKSSSLLIISQQKEIASLTAKLAELSSLKSELEAIKTERDAAKRETFAAQEQRAKTEEELASIKRSLLELQRHKDGAEEKLKAQEAENAALEVKYDHATHKFKMDLEELNTSLAALRLELKDKEVALAAATSAAKADAEAAAAKAPAAPTPAPVVALSGEAGAGEAASARPSLSHKELSLDFLKTFDSNPAAGGAGRVRAMTESAPIPPREQLLAMGIKEETLRALEVTLEKPGSSDSKRNSLFTSGGTAAAAAAAVAVAKALTSDSFAAGLTNVRAATENTLRAVARTSLASLYRTPSSTTPSAASAAAAAADSTEASPTIPDTPTDLPTTTETPTLTDTATSSSEPEKMAFYKHLCEIIKQQDLPNNKLSAAQLACLNGNARLLVLLIPPGSSERADFLNSDINPLMLAVKSADLLTIDFINKQVGKGQRTLEVINSAARTGKTWVIQFVLNIVGAEKVDATTVDHIIASGSEDALSYARKEWPTLTPSELFLIRSMEEANIERVKFILTWWLSENLTFSEDLAPRMLMAACLSGQELALDFAMGWIQCLKEEDQGNILSYIDEFTKTVQNPKSRLLPIDQKQKTRGFINALITKRNAKSSTTLGIFKPLIAAAETEALKRAAINLFKVAASVNDQESIRFARKFGVTETDVTTSSAPPRAGSPY